MKVAAYSSSLASIYVLLAVDTAVCAFAHGVYANNAQRGTELILLATQFVLRVLLLIFTANLVASTASSSTGVVDALLSFKGCFLAHVVALMACLTLRIYRGLLRR